MTAEDGIRTAQGFRRATIVPIHYEGWKHFSESREDISQACEAAGIGGRRRWMVLGSAITV